MKKILQKIHQKIKEKVTTHLENKKKPEDIVFAVFFIGAIVLFLLPHFGLIKPKTNHISPESTSPVEAVGQTPAKTVSVVKKAPIKTVPVPPPPSPAAKSVYVYDITEDKVLLDKDADFILPLASMTKIMTAIVALENLGPDASLTITKAALAVEGDSGLVLGEKWKVGDLVKFMLVVSSNDAAHALALEVNAKGGDFTSLMNQKGKSVGLSETFFINETGLDATDKAGGSYGTAKDIATLLEYAVANYGTYFEPTQYKEYTVISDSGTKHKLTNTSIEVETVPHVIASKTGFTDLAGGNLVFIFEPEPGHRVAVALFDTDRAGRFTEAKKYADFAAQAIKNTEALPESVTTPQK